RYRRPAGQEPAARRLHRRPGISDAGSALRSAPGHRFRADQLDRRLHPGARRRTGRPAAPPAGSRRVGTARRSMLTIKHPKLQQLYDYWSAKRGERKMPSRADIDPLDMTFIIGNVILVDVIAGTPLGFRIRLHGTNLVERVHYELTGKMLDDLPQVQFRNLTRKSFTKVAKTAKPLRVLNDR